MIPAKTIEHRLQALEDQHAIIALKARYLAACDDKDPAAMRACFCDGIVAIDYGAIGCFNRADALVAVFTELACHPHMVEMHHGVNPEIALDSEDSASGTWGLHYQLINTQDHTLTQLGARYQDQYRKTAAGWKISASRCVVHSTLVLHLSDDAVRALVRGRVAG
jgi:hypothetical protein